MPLGENFAEGFADHKRTSFEISDKPLDEEYRVLLQSRTDEHHAIVERKEDGERFDRVKTLFKDVKESWDMEASVMNRPRLEIMQKLRHDNIYQIADAHLEKTSVLLYEEVGDLGSLATFAERNGFRKGGEQKERIPPAFAWHVLFHCIRTVCYLTYGYQNLRKVVSTIVPEAGWDPVIHTQIYDGSEACIWLKTSKKEKYPVVVFGNFESCRQRSEFIRCGPFSSEKRSEMFMLGQQDDLCQVIRFMYSFLNDVEDRDAQPIKQLLQGFHQGSNIEPRSLAVDAREMAKQAREEFWKHDIPQKEFPRPPVSVLERVLEPEKVERSRRRGESERWITQDRLDQSISPVGMRYPKAGSIRPNYAMGLGERLYNLRVSRHPFTTELARYYLHDQLKFDEQISARIFEFDRMLRDIAKSGRGESYPFKQTGLLGTGGYGKVTRWTREIPDRNTPGSKITQHVAIKDFKQIDQFDKDYNAEFYVTRRLNLRGCSAVIKAYDYGVYNSRTLAGRVQPQFRMLLEWCSYGDLTGVLNFYERYNLDLSEAFVWHVARGLAEALLYCHNGGIHQNKASDWHTVIHMDLKPHNVFLTNPANPGAKYADVKLGDFGMARVIPNEEVAKFKSIFGGTGTEGYRDPYLDQGHPITEESDIYSFGVILGRMIQTFYDDLQYDEEYVLKNSPERLHYMTEDYYPCSPKLIDLKRACLSKMPAERPTAWEIHQIASAKINGCAMAARPHSGPGSYILVDQDSQRRFKEGTDHQDAPRKMDWYKRNQHLMNDLRRAADEHAQERMYGM